MTANFSLLLLLTCFFVNSVFSQGIQGRISNSAGENIPYASIYVPQLSTGTTSNHEGKYELKIPEGSWTVLFQYLGYQTETREIKTNKSIQRLDVVLSTQNYVIPEIEVLASKEDPAWYIMRKAISMAPYFQKQVSKYSCKVYLKGTGVFEKIPSLLAKQMKKEGLKENQPFVMETMSKIDFELPDKVNQQVLAMRSSGQQNNTSPMGMITNNLYDAEKYGVVSPVGRTALKMYDFKLEGVFTDQERTINKIKVIPKSKGNSVFSGYIFIASDYWNIHSADLQLRMPMTDVNFHQVYAEVNKNTWMPVSLDFDMNFSMLGLKMNYKYVASISEYKTTLNPALDHTFLQKIRNGLLEEQNFVREINQANTSAKNKPKQQKKISGLMNNPELNNRQSVRLNRLIERDIKRGSPPEPLEIKSTLTATQKQVNNDSAFWATLRPIPLSENEKKSFVKKDSFLRISVTPRYKDSIRDSRQKFKAKHLLFGKNYNYSVDTIRQYEFFSIPNLLNPTSFSFNTVDGLRTELPFSYYRSDSTGRTVRLNPNIAYAFARKRADASFSYSQRFRGLNNSWLTASIGSTTEDYNRNSGVSTLTNEFYTLFREQNQKRYYRRDFFQVMYSRDIANGLNWNEMIEYTDNYALENHSSFTFIDYKDKKFLPNIPDNSTLQAWQLENHRSATFRFTLEYTPQNRYRIRDNRKMYAGSKFPTFSLGYKSAFSSLLGTDSKYSLLKIGIRQKIDYGFENHFSYLVSAGAFLNKSHLYFEDFQHFNTLPTPVRFNSTENAFRLLPAYLYSTGTRYAEAHTDLNSNRILLKRLPFIKNLPISESIFVNYLTTPEIKNYVETGYGFSNLLMLFSAEVIAGFENGTFKSAGVKLIMNLK